MKCTWYTLAKVSYGTIKMRFRDQLTRNEAVELGINYCREKGMEYVGTYTSSTIDEVEAAILYETL